MSIQPIDLQTMYSQSANVAKALSGAQQSQLTEAMQQQNNIQRNMENAAKVQQASNEKTNTNNVNQNGSNSASFYGQRKDKNKQDKKEEQDYENHPGKSDYSYLGTIIDITR